MTQEMLRLIENEPKDIRHAIRLSVSALIFGSGIRGDDPNLGVNIEEVFNLLETLEKRNSLEASPLIGSWNPIVEALDRVSAKPRVRAHRALRSSGFSDHDFDRSIDSLVREIERMTSGRGGRSNDLKSALKSFGQEVRDNGQRGTNARPPEVAITRDIPGQGEIFRKARECMIRKLNDLVWRTEPDFASTFIPLVRAAKSEGITIATLNYDNGIELSAETEDVSVDFGIEQWIHEAPEASIDERSSIRLLKLHGSIDWQLVKNDDERARGLRSLRIHRMNRGEMNEGIREPALIFGGQNKLTASGPFLDLLMEFRDRLFEARELVVIGYSFSDQHINALIEEWVASRPESKVTIVCGENFDPREGTLGRRLLALGAARAEDTGVYAREGIATLFS